MIDVVSKEQTADALKIKELIATYKEAEDLINIGAYASGSNPGIDRAIAFIDKINAFLRQNIDDSTSLEESVNRIKAINSGESPHV